MKSRLPIGLNNVFISVLCIYSYRAIANPLTSNLVKSEHEERNYVLKWNNEVRSSNKISRKAIAFKKNYGLSNL